MKRYDKAEESECKTPQTQNRINEKRTKEVHICNMHQKEIEEYAFYAA